MTPMPDVLIVEGRLKIKALENSITDEAVDLMRQAYALLPRVKITDLLIEVDCWCDFTRHFLHLKSEKLTKNKVLVLTAVLADAINLGVTRMADACPGISPSKPLAQATLISGPTEGRL